MKPGQVELVLPDRTLVLPQVPAASGARYQEGRTVFWNQGNEARFEIDGKVYSGLHSPTRLRACSTNLSEEEE